MCRELFLARRMRPCRPQDALHRSDRFRRNALRQVEDRLAAADQLEIDRGEQFAVDPSAVFFARELSTLTLFGWFWTSDDLRNDPSKLARIARRWTS